VVGAGWIGLEIAATACSLGHEVTLVEMTDRVCSRSVMPEVSDQLAELHRSHGVKLLLNAEVAGIRCIDSGGSCVTLASGDVLMADTIVLGAGLIANDELARDAGLVCDRGVLVNDRCQTSDSDIFAAGDVAVIRFADLSLQCRLECWQNAQDQGIAAAQAMLDQPVSYQPTPLVWSDQYDCRIQIAGHAQLACKTLMRNAQDPISKIFFGLNSQNQIVAVVAFNDGREFRAARKLVERSAQVDPLVLTNLSQSLSDITREPAHPTAGR
jgi:3-phenylpropionate/trans-cinnamate dioxygenase ferredoxin reductase subunit